MAWLKKKKKDPFQWPKPFQYHSHEKITLPIESYATTTSIIENLVTRLAELEDQVAALQDKPFNIEI